MQTSKQITVLFVTAGIYPDNLLGFLTSRSLTLFTRSRFPSQQAIQQSFIPFPKHSPLTSSRTWMGGGSFVSNSQPQVLQVHRKKGLPQHCSLSSWMEISPWMSGTRKSSIIGHQMTIDWGQNRCRTNANIRGTSTAFKNPVFIALSRHSPSLPLKNTHGEDSDVTTDSTSREPSDIEDDSKHSDRAQVRNQTIFNHQCNSSSNRKLAKMRGMFLCSMNLPSRCVDSCSFKHLLTGNSSLSQ